MAWVKIKKSFIASDEPIISLNNNRFSYNIIFSRIAELEKNQFVTYYFDEENRKIGFEFSNVESPDSFKIILNKQKGNYSQSTELFSKKWIQKVSNQKEFSRFKPTRDGKKYIITLIPVFEFSLKREDINQLNSEVKGIYRYLDNSNVVYIGKGLIRMRIKEPARQDWKFDVVEYSVISDEDLQYEWESFWLEKFKDQNEGRLPAYNLISGRNP